MHLQLRRLRDPHEPLAALDAGLSEAERVRAARFVRPQDAAAFRLARTLVRRGLGAALGLAPARVPLVVDETGRPGCPVAGAPVFSITHCAGLVVVAWADAGAVGVDAEPLSSRIDAQTAATFLSPLERDEIGALPAEARGPARLLRFVAKEALLKARGTGFIADPTALHLAQAGSRGATRSRPTVRLRDVAMPAGIPDVVEVRMLAGTWLIGVCGSSTGTVDR